jgi:hypothetical protein
MEVTVTEQEAAIIKAAKDLMTHWTAYRKHAGTHEEAYYRLAKYAYPEWKKLEEALEVL